MKDSAKRYVYADNAATTAVSPQVVEAMLPYLTEHFGNPSSLYMLGQTAHNAVETAVSYTHLTLPTTSRV